MSIQDLTYNGKKGYFTNANITESLTVLDDLIATFDDGLDSRTVTIGDTDKDDDVRVYGDLFVNDEKIEAQQFDGITLTNSTINTSTLNTPTLNSATSNSATINDASINNTTMNGGFLEFTNVKIAKSFAEQTVIMTPTGPAGALIGNVPIGSSNLLLLESTTAINLNTNGGYTFYLIFEDLLPINQGFGKGIIGANSDEWQLMSVWDVDANLAQFTISVTNIRQGTQNDIFGTPGLRFGYIAI